MSRATFQAAVRSSAGRSISTTHKVDGLPAMNLLYNMQGPMQLRLSAPADAAHVIGMLPAGFIITGFGVIVPGGAGTFALDLPAYNGAGAVSLVAALTSASAASAVAATAVGPYAGPYDDDRPVTITTSGVTGEFNVGLWGFPLDDASIHST